MRLRPFILCFNRTAFVTRKNGLKSSAFRPNPFPRISPKSCRRNAGPNRFSSCFSTSLTNGPRSLSRVKVGTHSPSPTRAHTAAHRAKHGVFWMGGAISTLGPFHTFANLPGPGVSTANFAAFGSWPGVLQKNAESLRNSDALMRVVVPKASRPRWAA